MDLKMKGMDASIDSYIDAYVELAKALEEIITGDTIMNIVERIVKLPGEAEDIKNGAQGEFDALNGLNKVKAVANCAENIVTIKKVPSIVTSTIDGFKKDLSELKEICEDLNNNQQKYIDDGKKCQASKHTLAVPCYKLIHGDIK